jgi:hypothetical protein
LGAKAQSVAERTVWRWPAGADADRFEQQQDHAAKWAATPIGAALGGSIFVVTEHSRS